MRTRPSLGAGGASSMAWKAAKPLSSSAKLVFFLLVGGFGTSHGALLDLHFACLHGYFFVQLL